MKALSAVLYILIFKNTYICELENGIFRENHPGMLFTDVYSFQEQFFFTMKDVRSGEETKRREVLSIASEIKLAVL